MISEGERLDILLGALLRERPEFSCIAIPDTIREKRDLLRSLMNVRGPQPFPDDMMSLQDEELALQRDEKGVVALALIPLSPLYPRLRLWHGDITRLQVDAIVNAANSQMLGCFVPLHRCIDNAIFRSDGSAYRNTFAGE